jgi:hypothetical protein
MKVSPIFCLLALGCISPHRGRLAVDNAQADTSTLLMRVPGGPAPRDSSWKGRALATATRLEIAFPVIAANNVGCAAVDSFPQPQRRYYWSASADYPGAGYPNNHFQQVVLDFGLRPNVLPTAARLDSAIRATPLVVAEAGGEPPMRLHSVRLPPGSAHLESAVIAGQRAWLVRFTVTDPAALRAFRATGADSVSLGWCQRDQWLTFLHVRLERQ